MTDRVFQDYTSFEVSNRYANVEFYLFESREVKVNVTDEELVFIVGVLLGFFVSFPTTFLILEVSKWLMN